jgi:hypothetical protein
MGLEDGLEEAHCRHLQSGLPCKHGGVPLRESEYVFAETPRQLRLPAPLTGFSRLADGGCSLHGHASIITHVDPQSLYVAKIAAVISGDDSAHGPPRHRHVLLYFP